MKAKLIEIFEDIKYRTGLVHDDFSGEIEQILSLLPDEYYVEVKEHTKGSIPVEHGGITAYFKKITKEQEL